MKRIDENQLKLRVPKGLRGKLEQSAQKSGLTLNAEIIRRLEQSFTRDDGEKSRQLLAQQSATAAIEQMIDRRLLVKFDPKKQSTTEE
jgi:Arc-like DNA binding domain